MKAGSVPPPEQHVDIDLHGVIGIRLGGARPEEVEMLRAHMGGIVRPCAGEPDIVIRIAPHVRTPRLRYVELGKSGFSDDDFFVLSHQRRAVRARIAWPDSEGPFQIECERGVRSVPLLDDLIRLIAVKKGYAPIHASAFEYQGKGVLVAGAAHGGKTSCLLAFAQAGAGFISDDLVLLREDGDEMLGFQTALSVSGWQLDQLSGVRSSVGGMRRVLSGAGRGLERLQSRSGAGRAGRFLHLAVPALQRRLKVSVPPQSIFARVGPFSTTPEVVFLALTHDSADIHVEPADSAIIADQLATSFSLQLHACVEQYLAYRFAFPERTCEVLEGAQEETARVLRTALADKEVFVVRHPHRADLRSLHRAMHPFAGRERLYVGANGCSTQSPGTDG